MLILHHFRGDNALCQAKKYVFLSNMQQRRIPKYAPCIM